MNLFGNILGCVIVFSVLLAVVQMTLEEDQRTATITPPMWEHAQKLCGERKLKSVSRVAVTCIDGAKYTVDFDKLDK